MPAQNPTATDAAPQETSSSGLTIPQILAGALAAATAAILGSFLGVFGTIGGAAAASIVSTVGTTLYQKSLERTQSAMRSRLVVNAGSGSKVAGAVARATGQTGAPNPRSAATRAVDPHVAHPGAPSSPPLGTPRAAPPGARPGMPAQPGMPPMPTHRMPNGALAPGTQHVGPPGAPQQLRTGGRIVTARMGADGVPDETRRIPDGRNGMPPRGPDGRILPPEMPTQVVGTDGRTVRAPVVPGQDPTAVMGGQPTAWFGGGGPDDDATQVAPAATPVRRTRSWKFWATLGGVAASIFAIGLLASFAVESVAGHPLSGGTSGTSVGAIFGQDTQAPATTGSSATDDQDGAGSETTTTSSEEGAEQQGGQRTTTSRAPATTTSQAPSGNGGALQTSVQRYLDQQNSSGN